MSKPKATPVKVKKAPVRRTCKHPGRFWNRCKNCPLRKG